MFMYGPNRNPNPNLNPMYDTRRASIVNDPFRTVRFVKRTWLASTVLVPCCVLQRISLAGGIGLLLTGKAFCTSTEKLL